MEGVERKVNPRVTTHRTLGARAQPSAASTLSQRVVQRNRHSILVDQKMKRAMKHVGVAVLVAMRYHHWMPKRVHHAPIMVSIESAVQQVRIGET